MTDNACHSSQTFDPLSAMPLEALKLCRWLVLVAFITGLGALLAIYMMRTVPGPNEVIAMDLSVFRFVVVAELVLCLMSILGTVLVVKAQPAAKLVCLIVAILNLPSIPIGTLIGVKILRLLHSQEVREYLSADAS